MVVEFFRRNLFITLMNYHDEVVQSFRILLLNWISRASVAKKDKIGSVCTCIQTWHESFRVRWIKAFNDFPLD